MWHRICFLLLALTTPCQAAAPRTYSVTIKVVNQAPINGTCQTPLWLAIQDGSFDMFNLMEEASPAMERLAEDGMTGPLGGALVESSADYLFAGAIGSAPICPGESASIELTLNVPPGKAYYMSFASMVLPSNDAFVANDDPLACAFFDPLGDFVGSPVISLGGDKVLDAGTEVNDELPMNTPLLGQMTPDTGTPEGGTIELHPGFNAVGTGGILDQPMYSNADFTAPGYELFTIETTAVEIVTLPFQVSVENTAPQGGTCFTPPWLAIHDGTFDLYDMGAPASPELERLAEDGNAGPLTDLILQGSAEPLWVDTVGSGPLCPGQKITRDLFLQVPLDGNTYYLSYASMLLPSNDAFVANGNPMAFAAVQNGAIVPVMIEDLGSDVLDAGTEVNDEVPANTAFFGQSMPDTGIPENGVVTMHPGFLAAGSGGILDSAMFPNADFTQPDYSVMKIDLEPRDPQPTRYQVKFQVKNEAPDGGTCVTPVWFGIHEGTFDIYNRGEAASPELEALAEDGNAGPLGNAFAMAPGSQRAGVAGSAPICPGETSELVLEVVVQPDTPLYMSFASMVLPSNDAFVANGSPTDCRLFGYQTDPRDAFTIVVPGSGVLDAGTEVNDELPENTPLLGQMAPNTGTTENGVVEIHPGFNPVGSSGVLDNPTFVNADFTVSGYEVMSIQVEMVEVITRLLTIEVENTAPQGGTCQTPTWVGIHDGSFDIYDRDAPASPELERMAEDGSAGPLSMAFAATPGGLWNGVVGSAPICPGEIAAMDIAIHVPVDQAYYFSYISMVLPSNDAFLANGNPVAFPIFLQGFLTNVTVEAVGSDVLDAGTEVNDELPANTAFFGQMMPNTGTDENGVVTSHPGFLPAGSGGILDSDMFANADFTVPDYSLMTVRVRERMPEPTYFRVSLEVQNTAPVDGTCQTPVWFGLHDGTFDLYDRNEPASPELERLAEDGNTGPLSDSFALSSGGLVDGVVGSAPFCPGETVSQQFSVLVNPGKAYYMSFASMVLPSNDAFVANGDPRAFQFFDPLGQPGPPQQIDFAGSDILDAGTEVNDELPANTPLLGQMTPDFGIEEGLGVRLHPGFLPAGSGGILDNPMFASADFTVAGYEAMSIQVSTEPLVMVQGTIMVENTAPAMGTCQTPVWLGIHDGSFDLYNRGEPASMEVERMAEDGDAGPLSDMFAASDVDPIWQAVVGGGPLCAGESAMANFTIMVPKGKAFYLSYISMVIPSNDAFVANGDPMAHMIVNDESELVFVSRDIMGDDVLDAGTEMNDEIPENTAFFGQSTPDTGMPENGVITSHPGFLPAGSGGILDSAMFVNADFTNGGDPIARTGRPEYALMRILMVDMMVTPTMPPTTMPIPPMPTPTSGSMPVPMPTMAPPPTTSPPTTMVPGPTEMPTDGGSAPALLVSGLGLLVSALLLLW